MTTTVRLPQELESRLERLADVSGRSKSYYLRTLAEENIARLEWEAQLAAKAADIRAGRRQTVSMEELEADLDLEG